MSSERISAVIEDVITAILEAEECYSPNFDKFEVLAEVANLNEPQSTLLMTYMKNTEIVRTFKMTLVKGFYEAREMLRNRTQDFALPNFNNPAESARAWAEEYERAETETLRADEAVREKGQISSSREAKVMGLLGVKTKENKKLKEQLGIAETYKQAKAIGWLDDYFILNKVAYQQIGRQLSKLAREMDIPAKEIANSEFETVKAYHADVIVAFKAKIDDDLNFMSKYRKEVTA